MISIDFLRVSPRSYILSNKSIYYIRGGGQVALWNIGINIIIAFKSSKTWTSAGNTRASDS